MVEVLNISELAEELQEIVKWQDTPEPLQFNDYVKIVVRAVRKFFVDINHPEEYQLERWTTDENDDTCYDRTFNITEEDYIKILCRIEFIQRVQMDKNGMVSYSTDAITVSNADKPFVNMNKSLEELQHERRIVYNKMIEYTLGVS